MAEHTNEQAGTPDIADLKSELQSEAEARGLSTDGTKAEILERIQAFDNENADGPQTSLEVEASLTPQEVEAAQGQEQLEGEVNHPASQLPFSSPRIEAMGPGEVFDRSRDDEIVDAPDTDDEDKETDIRSSAFNAGNTEESTGPRFLMEGAEQEVQDLAEYRAADFDPNESETRQTQLGKIAAHRAKFVYDQPEALTEVSLSPAELRAAEVADAEMDAGKADIETNSDDLDALEQAEVMSDNAKEAADANPESQPQPQPDKNESPDE